MDGVTFVPPSHHFSSSPLSNPTKSRALNKITLLSYDLLVGSFLKSERFIALVVIYFHVNNKKKKLLWLISKILKRSWKCQNGGHRGLQIYFFLIGLELWIIKALKKYGDNLS